MRKAMPSICAVVEEETGHDFSRYKRSTLLRRVRRRMRVLAIESEADYLRHLRGDPAEAQSLLRDFLIGVTQFFRDPEAFEGLAREVIEPLVAANAHPTGQIRAWVPACSTGEEAFTVAMLLREACQRHTIPPQVTIFATDIDRHALDVARLGRYPESIAAQLTPERIERLLAVAIRSADAPANLWEGRASFTATTNSAFAADAPAASRAAAALFQGFPGTSGETIEIE